MQSLLEEFLSKWSLLNEEIYVFVGSRSIDDRECFDGHAQLTVDEYLQLVHVYLRIVTEIGLKDVDLAVSWVEKAALPEGKRQVNSCFSCSTECHLRKFNIGLDIRLFGLSISGILIYKYVVAVFLYLFFVSFIILLYSSNYFPFPGHLAWF